jgi:hypothetical protein
MAVSVDQLVMSAAIQQHCKQFTVVINTTTHSAASGRTSTFESGCKNA